MKKIKNNIQLAKDDLKFANGIFQSIRIIDAKVTWRVWIIYCVSDLFLLVMWNVTNTFNNHRWLDAVCNSNDVKLGHHGPLVGVTNDSCNHKTIQSSASPSS